MKTVDIKSANKQSKRLGYEMLETTEIVNKLNISLSTYQVLFHKLQNFHWNTVGSDFFDIHEITEDMYKMALKDIDDIAERIRVFGQKPEGQLTNYLERSLVSESNTDKSSEYMVYEMITDLQALTEAMLAAHEQATAHGDIGTAHMMSAMVKNLETYHWQLSSWANRRFAS